MSNPSQLLDSTLYAPCSDVIFQELDGELVLLNLKTELYFGLNPVGRFIWQLLNDNCSLSAIVERLCSEYDVQADQARTDVQQLIEALLEANLIESTA